MCMPLFVHRNKQFCANMKLITSPPVGGACEDLRCDQLVCIGIYMYDVCLSVSLSIRTLPLLTIVRYVMLAYLRSLLHIIIKCCYVDDVMFSCRQ